MKEVALRNVIALCKLQTFPHMFVCQKKYLPQKLDAMHIYTHPTLSL